MSDNKSLMKASTSEYDEFDINLVVNKITKSKYDELKSQSRIDNQQLYLIPNNALYLGNDKIAESGRGSTVTVDPKLTSGKLIATISVDGNPTDIYAPEGSTPGQTITAGQGLTYNSSTGEIKIDDTIYGIIQALSGLVNINSIVITES